MQAQGKSEDPGSEQRKHRRLECGGSAEVRVLPYGSAEPGSVVDLSRNGCCFQAVAPLRGVAGSRIELHMKVCGLDVRVIGVIRHTEKQMRAGIEFVSLTDRKRGELDELLEELAEQAKQRPGPEPDGTAAPEAQVIPAEPRSRLLERWM